MIDDNSAVLGWMDGNLAYTNGELEKAEKAFSLAASKGDNNAKNNLAYMIRRGETIMEANKRMSVAARMLQDGAKRGESFALVNMALLFALNLGTKRDWMIADQLMALLADDIDSVCFWWENIAQKDDPEGWLIHLWLLRQRKIDESSLGSFEGVAEKVKSSYDNLPPWIAEKIEEITI